MTRSGEILLTLLRHRIIAPFTLLPLPWYLRMPLAILRPLDSEKGRGKRLVRALTTLGPAFVKLGQLLSTRPDLVGVQMAAALSELQDRLKPFSAPKARRMIESELRHPVEEIFTHLEPEAAAAASVAQVHFAVLKNGTKVAVKLLRPGVEEAFRRDLALLRAHALRWEKHSKFRRLRPLAVVEELERIAAFECDLRFEAAAASLIKERDAAHQDGFLIPAVHWPYTTRQMLVMERVEGVPLSQWEHIRLKHDSKGLLERIALGFFRQALEHGYFHGDLHPGNVLIKEEGDVALIDFGITGQLDLKTRKFIARIFYGFLAEEYEEVAKAHLEAGYIPPETSVMQFAQACMAIGKPLLGKPLQEVSIARLLAQLFQITETFGMRTQPQLLLFQKTLVQVEGLGRMLCPEINMWKLIEPVLENWIRRHASSKAKVGEGLQQLAAILANLPETALRLMRLLEEADRKNRTP